MSQRWCPTLMGFCGLFAFALAAFPSQAQTSPVQPKTPMYTYVANWQIPRAHWSEMPASEAADKGIMDKAVADGTLIGYGDDEVLVHSADGETHDDWWSSSSMAGLLKLLNQLYASGNVSSPALDSATKHWDQVFISRYYNMHPGAYKSAYTYISTYQLKPDAPMDALDTLSQNIVVPVLEKLLADGTIIEYEIDELTIHTEAAGSFSIVTLSPNPDGIDKVNAAIADAIKAQPLLIPAWLSMTNPSAERDELLLSEGTYK
ncbi:MAG: hypothetical protein WBW84_13735 [Acidobacteriaceae bacterium]